MRYFMAIALAGSISASPAVASPELSDKYGCSDCHRVQLKEGQQKKKKEGPTYMEIVEKYKGKKEIEKQLVDSITKGSKGRWGKVEMDADTDIPAKDAEAIAKWIMSL